MPALFAPTQTRSSPYFSFLALSLTCTLALCSVFERAQDQPGSSKIAVAQSLLEYDASTPIDKQIASDFVNFWAKKALNFEPNSAQTAHDEAYRWVISDEMSQAINRMLWRGHESAPVVRGTVVSVTEPFVFDAKSAGFTINALLTRAGHDTERMPILMHVVVSKEEYGYRIQGLQIDYVHDDLAASLACSQYSRPHLIIHWGDKKGSIESLIVATKIMDTFKKESKYSMEAKFFSECVKSALDK